MRIYIDADAIPVAIREILFRAAEKNRIITVLVANQKTKHPDSEFISSVAVPAGPDEADDFIAENVLKGDLVITADIPLADRVITRGGHVISHRGEMYTADNIKERLTMRDFMAALRDSGIDSGGPAPLSQKDRREFAGQLDRFMSSNRLHG
ncbi:MAG: YaiI/YqxD family protein [Spirochaetota bacterium]